MPIKQNAKKALRQAKKRTLENRVVRDAYQGAMKVVKKAVIAGKDVKEELRLAQQALDKAAKKGVMKKNTAARKLSRLMKQVQVATAKK